MEVNFIILGRLGNAIYRYMAAVIVCIIYNGTYFVNNNQREILSDNNFSEIFLNNKKVNINSVNMYGYYQHDTIYKNNKNQIIDFIKKNPDHYILTDGINAGDGNNEKFYMINILNTPSSFTKRYKNVLHVRLEDFVMHNLYIKKERIIELLQKIDIDDNKICIVCKKPETEFEKTYILNIEEFFKNKNINVIIESNDVLTDYYIMKEAEVLICSKSTLSWCAAFFSDKIQQCYLPDYEIQPNIMTCKSPIDNTILY
jgi:hypothetical protein